MKKNFCRKKEEQRFKTAVKMMPGVWGRLMNNKGPHRWQPGF